MWGGRRRRSCHHAGVVGAVGGAAAAGRERRDRAAARGRRGAHPAAVPAVPGADAGAGDPERAPQRLHVVLDLLALLAQLGRGAGPLPLPRPFGLDGRGAGDPSGRRGIGAAGRGTPVRRLPPLLARARRPPGAAAGLGFALNGSKCSHRSTRSLEHALSFASKLPAVIRRQGIVPGPAFWLPSLGTARSTLLSAIICVLPKVNVPNHCCTECTCLLALFIAFTHSSSQVPE